MSMVSSQMYVLIRETQNTKKNYFFEEELYKELFVIERTNAWMDGFRSFSLDLIQQFPIGRGWSYLVFTVIWLNKTHKSQNLNEFNVFSRHEHVHASNDGVNH